MIFPWPDLGWIKLQYAAYRSPGLASRTRRIECEGLARPHVDSEGLPGHHHAPAP